MAEKRMFSKRIIDTDVFLELPCSAQALYFHLSMRADDDGFVDKPKTIMKIVGAKDDDLKLLILKQLVLPFETGIIVITHWRINNYLRNDRYKPTNFVNEKEQLELVDDVYQFKDNSLGVPTGIPTGTISISKSKKDINSNNREYREEEEKEKETSPTFIELPLNTGETHKVTLSDIAKYKSLYPAVNIEQEFRNMYGWLDSNPTRRKTKKGIKQFITSWLSKSQDQAGRKNIPMPNSKYSKNNPPLDENGNIDLSCGGTFRGTIL